MIVGRRLVIEWTAQLPPTRRDATTRWARYRAADRTGS